MIFLYGTSLFLSSYICIDHVIYYNSKLDLLRYLFYSVAKGIFYRCCLLYSLNCIVTIWNCIRGKIQQSLELRVESPLILDIKEGTIEVWPGLLETPR